MRHFLPTLLSALGLICHTGMSAQKVYELTAPIQPKSIRSEHLRMGGKSLTGDTIGFNNFYMSINGKPVIPVTGEFHYSRYPASQWEDEILKIKAGCITVIPTYLFWSMHEEVEGHFRWDGHLDLRRFLELCKKHQMQVVLRIGPFCHGEIRNGALPDWLFAKPLEVRSNNPEYLRYVRRLFNEYGKQTEGLFFKDGGPVIGVQIENEMQHSAAPWGINYPDEPMDFTAASYNAQEANIGVEVQELTASDPEMGTEHMRTLKRIAQEAGIDPPFFTNTGWGNAAVLEGEAIPVTAAYTYPFWEEEPTMSPFLMFKDLTKEADYAPTRYNPSDYPSFCAEMGAGIQMIYRSRPIVTAEAAEGLMVRTLGSGANAIGYYMYHGGSTPLRAGGGSFNDEPMGMPKISYDYQAPLGEFGLEGKMYRNLRLLHSFLTDFGSLLAPMEPVLPKGWEAMTPDNRDDLRFAARIKDGQGFVFMVNFQDHDSLRHDMTDLQLRLNLHGETLHIPATGSFTLPKDQSVILPFNFVMGDALLKYATAQLLMMIDDNGTEHYIFFAPEGMAPQFSFDPTTVKGKSLHMPVPGFRSTFDVKTKTGQTIRITTLTRSQALNALKVNGKLLIADATVIPCADGADLLCLGKEKCQYTVYPSRQGFRQQVVETEKVQPQFSVDKAGARRMSISIQQLPTTTTVQDYFLRINYTGDVAMAFMHDQLALDEFYHGEPWTIGLKRFGDDLKTNPLTFYFRPLNPDAPFLRDLPREAVPDFSNGPVVSINDVEIIPQYRLKIHF